MTIRLLLADDHILVRDGLRMILEAQADMIVVGEAADGREAVTLAAQLQPDVIIMDIAMPELNGIEATRSILDENPRAGIVMLSMHLSSEYIVRALRAGARGYLLKASASMELIAAVRAVAQGHRYLAQRVSASLVEKVVIRGNDERQDSPLERLSTREREILQLIAEGKSTTAIADVLSLSPSTVDTYRSRLMQKLHLTDLSGVIKFAIRHGLTTVE